LCEAKGKILLIGLKMSEALTSLHIIEDIIDNFRFLVYLVKKYKINVIDYNSNSHNVTIRVHNPTYSKIRKCDEMLQYFNSEIIKSFKIENADCLIIDADKMIKKQIELYNRGITII
jgi:aminoglycoside 3-N-acetyltransferase